MLILLYLTLLHGFLTDLVFLIGVHYNTIPYNTVGYVLVESKNKFETLNRKTAVL